jgi:hypothetical protein
VTGQRGWKKAHQLRCYWCGSSDPRGRDHVFPANLFASPRPGNLITVPACDLHNRVFSRDEEYFRDFILSGSYSQPEARRLWDEKTVSAIRRKPSYRALLAGQLQRLELRTPAGLWSSAVHGEWLPTWLPWREISTPHSGSGRLIRLTVEMGHRRDRRFEPRDSK